MEQLAVVVEELEVKAIFEEEEVVKVEERLVFDEEEEDVPVQ